MDGKLTHPAGKDINFTFCDHALRIAPPSGSNGMPTLHGVPTGETSDFYAHLGQELRRQAIESNWLRKCPLVVSG